MPNARSFIWQLLLAVFCGIIGSYKEDRGNVNVSVTDRSNRQSCALSVIDNPELSVIQAHAHWAWFAHLQRLGVIGPLEQGHHCRRYRRRWYHARFSHLLLLISDIRKASWELSSITFGTGISSYLLCNNCIHSFEIYSEDGTHINYLNLSTPMPRQNSIGEVRLLSVFNRINE